MPPVKVCRKCEGDVPLGQRCPRCEPDARRARRHPGYDDPAYRRHRRSKQGKPCERCGRKPGKILHHNDGDPGNNAESNHTWACTECAAVLDRAMRAARRLRLAGKPRSPWR